MTRRLAGATRATFRSFESRNFRLFFGGQLVSQVGNWMTLVAQALLVLELTDDGLAVGILAACQFAPVLLFGAWAGLVADRSDKRRLLLIVQTAAMAQSLALAGLAFMENPPVPAIYVLALLGGFAIAFDNPARRALVVDLVPQTDVHNAVSLNSALMTSSRVVGPALAGLLIVTLGFGWAFLVDAVSYLAVIGALWIMDPAAIRSSPATPRGRGQVREGLAYVRGVPELWIPLVMMAAVGTFAFNFQVVMPLFVDRTLEQSVTTFTLLFSFVSLGSLMGALATARRTTVGVGHVVVSSALFAGALAAFALAPNLEVALPLGFLIGVTSIAFLTSSTAIVQVRSAPHMRGRVLALQAIVFLGSTPVGGPILGWICDATSPRVGVLVGGLAAAGAAAWGAAAYRRSRDDTWVERVDADPAPDLSPA